jgi:hypothetical protein
MMGWWQRYWFRPAPLLDLAVVRIAAVGLQLLLLATYTTPDLLRTYALLPQDLFQPLQMYRILTWPLGSPYFPSFEMLQGVWYLAVLFGLCALLGLATNLSLAIFAAANVFLQAFLYSFGDLHHREAVMMIALGALALSPAGAVLSIDSLWRRRNLEGSQVSVTERQSHFARWPLLLVQWVFVLMYLSAVISKTLNGGGEWHNGFTLQYYLIQDGIRWDSPLALWLAQHHGVILLLQWFVLLFQATFALAVVFPRLRWVYVPVGLALHVGIYLTLTAPFFQWIVLYAVFIPWSRVPQLLRQRVPRLSVEATG